MIRLITFILLSMLTFGTVSAQDQYIFAFGRGRPSNLFVKELIRLTGKERPKICYLPTAMGDKESDIIAWYEWVHDLSVQPSVLRVWISSYSQKESFEDILMDVDAIVVGGGNTLNMIAIWKAQGIDQVLKKALEKGIVLAGSSAGSLAWFVNGTTDSRPKELSVVEGLGFLPYSHCPHYDVEEYRRPLYHKNIQNGIFKAGYAIDNEAGIIFKNGKPFKAVAIDADNNSYFVSLRDGAIVEEKLQSEILK